MNRPVYPASTLAQPRVNPVVLNNRSVTSQPAQETKIDKDDEDDE